MEPKKKMKAGTKAVIIICSILVVIGCWYFLFYQPTTTDTKKKNKETTATEVKIEEANAKKAKIISMQAEIEEIKAEGRYIKTYSYIENREEYLEFLNKELEGLDDVTITVGNVDYSDTGVEAVRREYRVSFDAENYAAARNIIKSIEEGPYMCILSNVYVDSMSVDGSLGGTQAVSVSLSLTFIDTAIDAEDTQGLPEKKTASKTESETEEDD